MRVCTIIIVENTRNRRALRALIKREEKTMTGNYEKGSNLYIIRSVGEKFSITTCFTRKNGYRDGTDYVEKRVIKDAVATRRFIKDHGLKHD